MGKRQNTFLKEAKVKSFDAKHRQTLDFNISRYDGAVSKGLSRYKNLELARDRAAWIKRDVLQHWDDYLIKFETNAIKNGAKVHWASDAEEAMQHVHKILKDTSAKILVKSKSMTTEELEFNASVESLGIESLETDLGEFIVQVAGEKPYHILTPAMHKSKEDVAALFHKIFKTPAEATPTELTHFVRKFLRQKFATADVGVTGANFLIAETGSVCLTENEGNILLSASMPETMIVIAGIEKLLPDLKSLSTIWPILAHKGTGQQLTAYNSIFTGPRKADETDGPKEMHILLLDNGRSDLYLAEKQYEALACIRCGACLNTCPIYRSVGGYTYDATYSGPIGSVITPFYKGFKEYKHLSFACSLCESCKDVCPVKIDLPSYLLQNRKQSVDEKLSPASENLAMNGMKLILGDRKKMDLAGGAIKNMGSKLMGRTLWGEKRDIPPFAKTSFSKQYKAKKKD